MTVELIKDMPLIVQGLLALSIYTQTNQIVNTMAFIGMLPSVAYGIPYSQQYHLDTTAALVA